MQGDANLKLDHCFIPFLADKSRIVIKLIISWLIKCYEIVNLAPNLDHNNNVRYMSIETDMLSINMMNVTQFTDI